MTKAHVYVCVYIPVVTGIERLYGSAVQTQVTCQNGQINLPEAVGVFLLLFVLNVLSAVYILVINYDVIIFWSSATRLFK